MQGDAREEIGDRGNEQVVEHDQPPGEEAGARTDPLTGVGEHRPGARHDPRHLGVRPGGEGHRDGGEHVDHRHGAVGARVEHPEHADRREGTDEQQAVDDEVAAREVTAKRGWGGHVEADCTGVRHESG